MNQKTSPKTLEGVVISDRMQKTVVVEVVRLKKHPIYRRYFKVSKKYKAHDEKNDYHIGEKVRIMETRPISKDKKWVVVARLKVTPKNDSQAEVSEALLETPA